MRAWSLSSSSLFTVKSFFSILTNHIDPTPSFPIDFVWYLLAPFKVKSFAWLVTFKKVNTNDMLQLRRSYKALSSDVCLLCMESGETVDHIFFTLPIEFGAMTQIIQLGSCGLGSS